MSRLRTSSPWTTPTTPLGARILSEEPATLEAVPTMTLAEMEAVLATSAPLPVAPLRSTPMPAWRSTPEGQRRAGRGGWAVGRRVLAAAAVLVALVGGTGGLAVGAGRPSALAPASATAPAPSTSGSAPTAGARGEASDPELAAALGEVMARHAATQGSPGPGAAPTAAVVGEAAARMVVSSTALAAASS